MENRGNYDQGTTEKLQDYRNSYALCFHSILISKIIMDIPKILDKLEPLMPEQTAKWKQSLPFVNDDTKSLIEKEIIATAPVNIHTERSET